MLNEKTVRILVEMLRGNIPTRGTLVDYLDTELGTGSGELLQDGYSEYFVGDKVDLLSVSYNILTYEGLSLPLELMQVVFQAVVKEPRGFVRGCLPFLYELAKLEEEDGRITDKNWFYRRIPDTRTRNLFCYLLRRHGVIGREGIIYRQNAGASTRMETADVPFADLLRTYGLLDEWTGVRHKAAEIRKGGPAPGRRIIVGPSYRMPKPDEQPQPCEDSIPVGLRIGRDRVLKEVCAHYNTTYEELYYHDRTPSIALARHVLMYLLCEWAGMSFPQIGKFLGGREHATIMHGRNVIEEKLKTSQALQYALREIRERLGTAKKVSENATQPVSQPPSISPAVAPTTQPPQPIVAPAPIITVVLEQWIAISPREARGLLSAFKTGGERRVSNVLGRFASTLVDLLRKRGYLQSSKASTQGTEIRIWKFQATHFAVFPEGFSIKSSMRYGLLAPAKKIEVSRTFWVENIRKQLEALDALEAEDQVVEVVETVSDDVVADAAPVAAIPIESPLEPTPPPEVPEEPEMADEAPTVMVIDETEDHEETPEPVPEEVVLPVIEPATVKLIYRFSLRLSEARLMLNVFQTGKENGLEYASARLGPLYKALYRADYFDFSQGNPNYFVTKFNTTKLKATFFEVCDDGLNSRVSSRAGFLWGKEEREVAETHWLENIRTQVEFIEKGLLSKLEKEVKLRRQFNLNISEAEALLRVFATGAETKVVCASKQLGPTLYSALRKCGYTKEITPSGWGDGTPFLLSRFQETVFNVHVDVWTFEGLGRKYGLLDDDEKVVSTIWWHQHLKAQVRAIKEASTTRTEIEVKRALIADKKRLMWQLHDEIAGLERQIAALTQETGEQREADEVDDNKVVTSK